jgi:peptidoglycan/LPS O-acetylase OafA/YrhL
MINSSREVFVRPTARPERLPSLAGWRFVAAAMVFIFHSGVENMFASVGVQRGYMSLFFPSGWMGVGFFFILSGFILTWVARPSDTARQFWRRRAAKIFPNHIITFIAAALLIAFVAKSALNARVGILNLALVHSWFPQIPVRISYNDVTWSLSCELMFYLAFPLLLRLINKIQVRQLWVWAGGVAAIAVIVIPAVATLLPHPAVMPLLDLSPSQFWIVIQFPPVRLLDFVFGMILARIVMTGRRLPVGVGGAVALTAATFALAPYLPGTFKAVGLTFIPLGLLVAASAKADAAKRPTWLASRTMVALGELSFAFYMWHRLVLVYAYKLLGGGRGWSTPEALGLLALMFGAALILAWLQFNLVERPFMRRFAESRRIRHATELKPVAQANAGPAQEQLAEPAQEQLAGLALAQAADVGPAQAATQPESV